MVNSRRGFSSAPRQKESNKNYTSKTKLTNFDFRTAPVGCKPFHISFLRQILLLQHVSHTGFISPGSSNFFLDGCFDKGDELPTTTLLTQGKRVYQAALISPVNSLLISFKISVIPG